MGESRAKITAWTACNSKPNWEKPARNIIWLSTIHVRSSGATAKLADNQVSGGHLAQAGKPQRLYS